MLQRTAQPHDAPGEDRQTTVIPVKDGNFVYTFTFVSLTLDDWTTFVDDRSRQTEEKLIALGESKLLKVEGYRGDIMAKPDWQKRILPRHMIPATMALMDSVDAKKQLAALRAKVSHQTRGGGH